MDVTVVLAALLVGIMVGLTGMGGGALMTPILVLVFGVPPLAAVSSDLVATAGTKLVGGLVHARRGTVRWPLVRWLAAGSVPGAFAGVLLLRAFGRGDHVQEVVRYALGGALLLAALGLVVKTVLGRPAAAAADQEIRVRRLPTLLVGVAGGLLVGVTSVGSGVITCSTCVKRSTPSQSASVSTPMGRPPT